MAAKAYPTASMDGVHPVPAGWFSFPITVVASDKSLSVLLVFSVLFSLSFRTPSGRLSRLPMSPGTSAACPPRSEQPVPPVRRP
jgi:hypothetical protein